MTINILPDDVLLEIFDFYVIEVGDFNFSLMSIGIRAKGEWKTLAHVCRRWRSVVFQSPRHLNLRLICTHNTPARDTLDIWPPFLLVIWVNRLINDLSKLDNIAAALEHNDRVCQIQVTCFTSSVFGLVTESEAMQRPFPELTDLQLRMLDHAVPIPDSFMSGTAPRLRSLELYAIPFPGITRLLSSATHLVNLDLDDIPSSGYIPPEAMATTLFALTSLESLRLRFESPRSHDRPHPPLESRRPPPLTLSILPSLTTLWFEGASEYLEVILAPIDAPRLNKMQIRFFFDQIIFATPQLSQFISRSPTLRAPGTGQIEFDLAFTVLRFSSQTSGNVLIVEIPRGAAGRVSSISSVTRVCTSSFSPVSTLEDLYIYDRPIYWQDDFENPLWLELLHSFAAVKNLYLRNNFFCHIAPILQEPVEGRTTNALPTLENIYLGEFQLGPSGLTRGIPKFVGARRLTGHSVTLSRWGR